MWDDIFSDLWSSRFPTTRSPFTGFGGFYGEGAHPFFPCDKRRKVSNQKKARLVDDRMGNPACCQHPWEKPLKKEVDKILKEKTNQIDESEANLPQATVDIPIVLQPPEEEEISGKNYERSSCDSQTNKQDAAGKPDADVQERIEQTADEEDSEMSHEANLPQATVDIPVVLQPPEEEEISGKNYERSSCDSHTNKQDAAGKPDADVQERIEQTADEEENSEMSHRTDNEVESAKESLSVQSGTHSVEEEKLNEIKIQLTNARELIARVKAFEGSRQDKEFLYLDEHLTRCILSLDLINTEGLENVKTARKEAVAEILSVINDLESRVQE